MWRNSHRLWCSITINIIDIVSITITITVIVIVSITITIIVIVIVSVNVSTWYFITSWITWYLVNTLIIDGYLVDFSLGVINATIIGTYTMTIWIQITYITVTIKTY